MSTTETISVSFSALMICSPCIPFIMCLKRGSFPTDYKERLLLFLPYVLISLSGFLYVSSFFQSEDHTRRVAVAWIITICALLFRGLIRYMQSDKEAEAQLEQKRYNSLVSFYEECEKNNIFSFGSEKDKQKASLIAEKNNLKYTDIEKLYNEAKQLYKEKQDKEVAKARHIQIEKMKPAEQRKFDVLNEFASYSKRDKRVAMLTKEYNEVCRELQTFDHLGTMLLTPQLEKEHDWAIMGGLANGLAGPGAGIATAVNAQIENAQIRARNEARWKNSIERRVDLMSAMVAPKEALENKQAELESKIEKAKISLVAEMTPQQCLDMLTVENPNVDVSETGTCTVDTKVSLRYANCYIFEDVKATIDGTIQAEIFDGNQKIGTANLVLPIDGIPDNNLVEVKGMCLFCGQPEKKYKVKFKADNLWVMEAMEEAEQ